MFSSCHVNSLLKCKHHIQFLWTFKPRPLWFDWHLDQFAINEAERINNVTFKHFCDPNNKQSIVPLTYGFTEMSYIIPITSENIPLFTAQKCTLIHQSELLSALNDISKPFTFCFFIVQWLLMAFLPSLSLYCSYCHACLCFRPLPLDSCGFKLFSYLVHVRL